MTIRLAARRDLPDLLCLYQALNGSDPTLEAGKADPIFATLDESPLTSLLVAEVEGVVRSSCLLLIVPNLTRSGRSFAMIENVVTHPEHRCLGLGTAILADALERAWAAKCYKVMLATGRPDQAVLRFYEKAGFTRGGKTFFEARRV